MVIVNLIFEIINYELYEPSQRFSLFVHPPPVFVEFPHAEFVQLVYVPLHFEFDVPYGWTPKPKDWDKSKLNIFTSFLLFWSIDFCTINFIYLLIHVNIYGQTYKTQNYT